MWDSLFLKDFVATVVKTVFFFSVVIQYIKTLCKPQVYLSR